MDLSRISKKNPYEDLRITLSAIDNNTIEKFDKYYGTLNEKKKMLANLHRKKTGIRVKYSNEYYDLCKKIENLEDEIISIENEDHKLDYLLRASSHFLEHVAPAIEGIPGPGPSGRNLTWRRDPSTQQA